MDDAVDGGVLGEHLVKCLLVGDVDLVKVGAAAGQQLDPVNRNLGRVVETVDNDDIVAGVEQGQSREGADVARATADWAQRSMLVQRSSAKAKKNIHHGNDDARPAQRKSAQSILERLRGAARGDKRAHLLGWRSIAEQRMEGEPYPVMRTVPTAIVVERLDCR